MKSEKNLLYNIDGKDKKNMKFGERVKYIIDSENITYLEFATLIRVKNSYITEVINDKGNFSDSTKKLICIVFKINEEWLYNGKGRMYTDEKVHSKQISTLVSFFEALNPEFQELAIKYFNYLLKLQVNANKQVKQLLKLDSKVNK